MTIDIDDIMKVEDELEINLSEEERRKVLDEFYERVSDETYRYEVWSDIVEGIIWEFKFNTK